MNMEITKNKNAYKNNSLEKRVADLEKILQNLLRITGGSNNSDNAMAKIKASEQNNILSELVLPQIAGNVVFDGIQTGTHQSKNSINNSQSSKSNLPLSRGQIIAELALAITRASKRNS